MPRLILLVGPPGSGKTTWSYNEFLTENPNFSRISQDDMGGKSHIKQFRKAIVNKENIIVDRMNFNKDQRNRYLQLAKDAGYGTEIIVFHTPMKTCIDRCMEREDHPTIKDAKSVIRATHFFFTKYERVEDDEADVVTRKGWVDIEPNTIVCDLDGTLADAMHRVHYVRGEGKKNWKKFFEEIPNDTVNEWCKAILDNMHHKYNIIYATGRSADCMENTLLWLGKHKLLYDNFEIFSRLHNDYRKDNIVKEIILEFEIKTRCGILFVVDDRPAVCRMWRKHGYTVLQCQDKEF